MAYQYPPHPERVIDAGEFENEPDEPMCSLQLIHYLLSIPNPCLEIVIFFSWATFYYYGLWDDTTRKLLKDVANKVEGYKSLKLPWLDNKEPAKSRFYPDSIKCGKRLVLLRQLYDHWNKKTILPPWFSVEKARGKGLHLICKYIGGIRLEDVFDAQNPGFLLPLTRNFFNKLKTEYLFDSIYEIRKEDVNNYRNFLKGFDHYALVGPQSLMNNDNNSQARLMHVEDNSRSFLMELKFHQYEHKFAETEDEPAEVVRSFSPVKVSQQALPDGRLTPEELNDDRALCERYWYIHRNYREDTDKLVQRAVTRATFIKDLSHRRFQANEELVIKYNDKNFVGSKPNKKIRDHQLISSNNSNTIKIIF